MPVGPERTGLWSAAVTVRRIVIDPVDVLLDLVAAERALWSWWAGHVGLAVDEVVAVADAEPLPTAVRRLRDRASATGGTLHARDDADDVAMVRARRDQLHRLVRRRRGASSLLRSIPVGRAAVWTTLEQEELARLESRARLTLPSTRLCGLAVSDTDRAARFLADQGDGPADWMALESREVGAVRSEDIGCRVVLVRPETGRGTVASVVPARSAGTPRAERMSAEDPALLGVTPAADGLLVSVRRQARLLPGG